MKYFIYFAYLSVCLLLPLHSHANIKPIKILVIAKPTGGLQVDYRSKGKLVRNLLMMGSLLDVVIDINSQTKNTKRFQKTIGEYDRYAILEKGIKGGLASQVPFNAIVVPSDSQYGSIQKPNLKKARKDGYRYILTVQEQFSGMISAWKMSTLSSSSAFIYRLINTHSGKTIVEDNVSGYAHTQHSLDAALDNRSFFINEYPQAAAAAIGRMIGDLRKNGFLHQIANEYGRGNEIPNTEVLTQRYESKFSYRYKPPKGWETTDMNTKYVTVLSPKEDKQYYGLNITFDLLLEEFGQNVTSAEEYAQIFLGKAGKSGFEISPIDFPKLNLNKPIKAYTVKQASSGFVNVIMFEKLSNDFIVIYSIVIINNHKNLYTKHKSGIEKIINTGRITIK